MDTNMIFVAALVLLSTVDGQRTTTEIAGFPQRKISMERFCSSSGYCYSLWYLDPPITKSEASNHCQSHNQTLATVPDTIDQDTLTGQLGSYSAWVGLEMQPTINWKWLGADGYYENTIPPGDIDDDNQACMIMNRGRVFGSACTHNLHYLCEFNAKPPASAGCQREPAYVGSKYICWKNDTVNWMNAARFCASQRGSLLNINNVSELEQIKQTLRDWGTGSHFYIGGTHVILSWKEAGVRANPYALKWSTNISANPNLDEAFHINSSLCIYLSAFLKSLVYKACGNRLPGVICSLKNQTRDEPVSTSTQPLTTISSGPNSTTASSTVTRVYEHTTTVATSSVSEKATSGPTKITPATVWVVYRPSSPAKGMVSEEKYTAAMSCAYVLAFLLVVVIALFVGVFIWRKRRKRLLKIQDPLYNRKAYKSLDNSVTLRRERNTNPSTEWDKVKSEHEEHLLEPDYTSMNIIHNVPLDPRGSVEEPLTIPRDSQVVAVHREMSRDSHNSSCGEVATFSSKRAGSTTSILKIPPPLPPKTACDPNANDQPLPPPPPDLLADSVNHSPPLPPKYPPPPDDLADPSGIPPPPPSKTNKRPPRRHKKKEVAPDPIYAQIDKTAKRPPPVSPKPNLRYLTNGSARPSIDTVGPQDNSDSGVEMNVHSPATSSKIGEPADQLELLDDVLNQLANA